MLYRSGPPPENRAFGPRSEGSLQILNLLAEPLDEGLDLHHRVGDLHVGTF